jgi:plastocyanin
VKITRLAALAPYALIACTDFGYRVPPPAAAIDATTPDTGGGACVEGATAASAAGPQVALVTLNVDRPMLQVAAGDVVTWTNTDTMVHTVTAGAPGAPLPVAQGGFDSGDIAAGAKWAYRFCAARTAIYYCKTHPGQMNGYRVVVR